jgi:YwiC-like protein
MATLTMSAQEARRRTMLMPREHGAWGILLVPLATGAIVASRSSFHAGSLVLFAAATLALFWLRTPFEAWLGLSPIKAQTGDERASVFQLTVLLGAIALASLIALFTNGYASGLVIIGIVAALAFGAQEMVKKLGRSGRMPAQIIGAFGLTSTSAGAYYVASGKLDRTAVLLWIANWLFAADQIHFVQTRIHGSRLNSAKEKFARGKWFVYAQVALIVVLAVASVFRMLPPWTWIAFAPALTRGIAWFVRPTRPLNVHKLGFSELAQAIVFGALLSAAFFVG